MKKEKMVEYLKCNKLFANVSLEDFQSIDFSEFKVQEFKKDEVIIIQNSVATHFYLILEGEVNIIKKNLQGEEFFIFSRKKTDFIGDSVLVSNSKRNASVKAKTNVILASIKKEDLLLLIDNIPIVKDNLLQRISERYSESDRKTVNEIEYRMMLEKLNKEIVENQDSLISVNTKLQKTLLKLRGNQKTIIELERKNSVLATAVTVNHKINQHLMIIDGNIELIEMLIDSKGKSQFSKKFKRIKDAVNEIANILKQMENIEEVKFSKYAVETDMIDL